MSFWKTVSRGAIIAAASAALFTGLFVGCGKTDPEASKPAQGMPGGLRADGEAAKPGAPANKQ